MSVYLLFISRSFLFNKACIISKLFVWIAVEITGVCKTKNKISLKFWNWNIINKNNLNSIKIKNVNDRINLNN